MRILPLSSIIIYICLTILFIIVQLYGKFLHSISEYDKASIWYQRAYVSYMQWGAKAKASRLQKEHAFEIPDENMSMSFTNSITKRERDDEAFKRSFYERDDETFEESPI